MNVALSRAKWKLVVVGSTTFLKEAAMGVNPEADEGHDLSFLLRVVKKIAELQAQRKDGAPAAAVVTPERLAGTPAPC